MAMPSGASSGADIIGLAEFRRELAQLDGNWTSQLSLAHQKIAALGASYSRAQARAMGGVQAKSASAIGGKHTERDARIAVLPSRLDRMANVAFWGAKRHTGWYARSRYNNSPPQHPSWIGNTWDVAVHGQGPYAINSALAMHLPKLLDQYQEMIDNLARRAFPEGWN